MSILALDLGTTFIKGAVLDLEKLRLHHRGHHDEQSNPKGQ